MSTLTLSPAFRPVAVRRPVAARVERRRPSTLRLTRRGRLVVFTASLLIAFVVGVVVAAGSVATGQAGTPEPTTIITVSSGETLWDIASDLAVDGDVRAMMRHIERLNALDSGVLAAGQRLVIPAS